MLHISVAGATGSKFTTSGAINSGVPNRTFKSPVGLYFLPTKLGINVLTVCYVITTKLDIQNMCDGIQHISERYFFPM